MISDMSGSVFVVVTGSEYRKNSGRRGSTSGCGLGEMGVSMGQRYKVIGALRRRKLGCEA